MKLGTFLTQTKEVVSYLRRSWRDVGLTCAGHQPDPGGGEDDPGVNLENPGPSQV